MSDWHREHVTDPRDTAGAYALLDEGQVREEPLCWCGNPLPCLGELEPMPDSVRRQRRTGYGWAVKP